MGNFLLPADHYIQRIDPVKDWVDQTALYVSRMKGRDYTDTRAALVTKLRNGEIKINNPTVVHFIREENGDRHQQTTPLNTYIRETVSSGDILVPTGTTYLHPTVEKSEIVGLLDDRVANRSRLKKIAAKFKAEGNDAMYHYYHNSQDCEKRTSNAVSGNFVSEGSVINNPSAHSTLTSITRSIGSLSNASNERLIEGNRHYYSPQIALNNAISIVSAMDYKATQTAMDLYQLHYPTVDEVMKVIRRSIDLYTVDYEGIHEVRAFIEKLSPIERAAVVYNGDLYHLRVFNPEVIRGLIDDFARDEPKHYEDPIKILRSADDLTINYAHQVVISVMRGKGMKYESLTLENQCRVASIVENIEASVEKYRPLLLAFFLNLNVPCTIASLPRMNRRAVVLSDTDSTMFSVDNWVLWYFGRLDFSDRGFAVAGAVMYMATQCIAHILAQFSANMNVDRSRLFTLAMKPEFCFPVFAQTSVSKHYYTAKLVKEGVVYNDIEMEIKGVHLKDSSVPVEIIDKSAAAMERIIRTVMRGELISAMEYIRETADTEREIVNSLQSGKVTYLKRTKIKEAKAYKKGPEESPYRFFSFWDTVFAPDYPAPIKPPYQAVRVPVNIPSKTKMAAWIDSMENRDMAERLLKWYEGDYKKVGQFIIPFEVCASYGIPKEILPILDYERVVLTLTKSQRNILESLGFFSKPDKMICQQGY